MKRVSVAGIIGIAGFGSALAVVLLASPEAATPAALAQAPAQTQASTPAPPQGIPVTSDLVKRKCGTCHRADAEGRLTRISERRTTPEGWEQTIIRMVDLNGVKLEPEEAREIIRYLSDSHGLAPEEAKGAAWEVERRFMDYTYTADAVTDFSCRACHSLGRILQQRRTKDEWDLLMAMHRGYYPYADTQGLRSGGMRRLPPSAPGTPPDTRQPMERVAAHLSTAFPLITPEWAEWSASMRPPQLQGRWAISGYESGKGPVFGQVEITPQGPADKSEFTTETTLIYGRTGETVTRRGRSVVYTGHQWRGKTGDWREVLFVDRDWRSASGRWFTGGYQEIGIDVRLHRLGTDPIVLGVGQPMLKTGTQQEVRLFGANLPSSISPTDVSFGAGVRVDRIVRATGTEVVAAVTVASDARPGRRAVVVAGAAGDATVAVHDGIDFIKVQPSPAFARLGGINFPKMLQQFEAVAYLNGVDKKPSTADDVELGLVDATWSLEEYTATYNDNDVPYVGSIDAKTGLFTPNVDGPNPNRLHPVNNNATNNFGDVWAVATYAPAGGKALKARGQLVVGPPSYIRFDQEVVK